MVIIELFYFNHHLRGGCLAVTHKPRGMVHCSMLNAMFGMRAASSAVKLTLPIAYATVVVERACTGPPGYGLASSTGRAA